MINYILPKFAGLQKLNTSTVEARYLSRVVMRPQIKEVKSVMTLICISARNKPEVRERRQPGSSQGGAESKAGQTGQRGSESAALILRWLEEQVGDHQVWLVHEQVWLGGELTIPEQTGTVNTEYHHIMLSTSPTCLVLHLFTRVSRLLAHICPVTLSFPCCGFICSAGSWTLG